MVDVSVPLLLGLDALCDMHAVLDIKKNKLSSQGDGWTLPLAPKMGHLYAEWSVPVNFTRLELQCPHRRFKHHTTESLTALLRRTGPHTEHPHLLKDLGRIKRNCKVCQQETLPPARFIVSSPRSDEDFNRTICINIMKLADQSVLQAVNKAIEFGAARFLYGESLDDVWATFDVMWIQAYIGPRTSLTQTPARCS